MITSLSGRQSPSLNQSRVVRGVRLALLGLVAVAVSPIAVAQEEVPAAAAPVDPTTIRPMTAAETKEWNAWIGAGVGGGSIGKAPGSTPVDPTTIPPAIRPLTNAEAEQWNAWVASAPLALAAGDWATAERLFSQILAIAEMTFGPAHPQVAATHGWLAAVALARGDSQGEERHLRIALGIREGALGADHPDTLLSLSNLAINLNAQGRYARAHPLFERALEARGRVLGPEHPETLTSLNNLAANLGEQGRFAEAQPLYERVLEARERVLGPEHPDTLTSLNDFAFNLKDQGRYAEAQQLFEWALEASERVLGPDHPDTLSILSNLASNLDAQGRHAEAQPLYERALDAQKRFLGPEHPNTLISLALRADNLNDQGRYSEAQPLYERALEAMERVIGSDDPNTLATLNNLALTLDAQGRYAEAQPLLERALAVQERVLGPEHPDTLTSLGNLAANFNDQGRYAEALPLYERAVAASLRALGEAHPSTALIAGNWALSTLRAGTPILALPPARMALEGRRAVQLREGDGATDASRGILSASTGDAAGVFLEAAYRSAGMAESIAPEDRPEALRAEAFAAAQLISVGGAAEAFARSAARLAAGQEGLEADARAWEAALAERATLDRQLAEAYADNSPNGEVLRGNLRARMAEVDTIIADVEARLDGTAFFELINPQPVSLAALQADGPDAMLREDEVLILITAGTDEWSGIVFAVTRDAVAWARIGMTPAEIRDNIARLREVLDPGNSRIGDTGRDENVGLGARGFDRDTAYALYQALFGDPAIAAVLADQPNWILVLQGDLISLPFTVLVTEPPEGSHTDPAALRSTAWLGLDRALTLVPAVSTLYTQRVLAPSAGEATQPFFGLGDPAFEGAPGDVRGLTNTATLYNDANGNPDAIRELGALPGTRTELLAVTEALEPGISPDLLLAAATPPDDPARATAEAAMAEAGLALLGGWANETQLVQRSVAGELAGARVLLFATHTADPRSVFNPLAEPALVLSPPLGADPVAIAGIPGDPDRVDDGLLTATEAARLDISAEWVILSACNTAAGGEPGAEGLTGLARGFLYAGAEALLVSHWPVSDTAGAFLVSRTVGLVAENPTLSRAAALQQAMRELMADTTQDATGASLANPAFWAPFALIGVQ